VTGPLLIRAVVAAALAFTAGQPAPADVVLVSRRDPGETISERVAARLFLKEKLFWRDGTRIVPVNLPPDHDARELFSRSVLRRSRRELVEFWNEEHFKGVNPPVVLESEDAVKAFVRQVDGAVGYIRRERLDPDLRVLLVVPRPR
jgi:ABC-type phosphate transport system substrate-binding protein